MAVNDQDPFRSVCERAGLAVTHQRQVIYDVLSTAEGHPSPEEVFAHVKQRIPSISLATVYKNLHLFIEAGIFAEVSMHHGSMRVEVKHTRHYHLICTGCKSIHDIEPELLGAFEPPAELLDGFRVERLAIDVLGLCADCRAAAQAGEQAASTVQ